MAVPEDVEAWDRAHSRPDLVAHPVLPSAEDEDAVSGAADLRRYAATPAVDFAGDGGSRAHGAADAGSDGWAARLTDTPCTREPEPLTWRSIAEQLSAAQIYE